MLKIRSKICGHSLSHSCFLWYYRPEKERRLAKFTGIIYSIETLMVNIVCVHGNSGNIHIRGTFFVAFVDVDYNRCLWIWKITWFSCCFGKEWVLVLVLRGWYKVLKVHRRGVTEIEQVQTRGEGNPNFGHFVRT